MLSRPQLWAAFTSSHDVVGITSAPLTISQEVIEDFLTKQQRVDLMISPSHIGLDVSSVTYILESIPTGQIPIQMKSN
jgi:hypothetical protein